MVEARLQDAYLQPFLSWAGSKRKLLRHLVPLCPRNYGRYFEPFLGGAALFFHLKPHRAEISDASEALIQTYRAVRGDAEAILKALLPLKPTKENFEMMKARNARSASGNAAKFIFLNKSCWNGLYRVNSQGRFNVPFGWPKTDFVVDPKNLLACAKQLRRREIAIRHQDFEAIEERVRPGDFIFLDPPYVTSHNMNGFADWNERLFRWDDQMRLAEMAKRLVRKKANVLITNADHADIRNLYPDFRMKTFDRASTLASDSTKRRRTSELILFEGPAYSKSDGTLGDSAWQAALSS